MTRLSDTQRLVLSAAALDDNEHVRLPNKLRGGAADAVLNKLEALGLIACAAGQRSRADVARGATFRITTAGREAVGVVSNDVASAADKTVVASSDAAAITGASEGVLHAKPVRSGTKGAAVVDLLARPEGASLADLVAATGWLPHTTRAALTGLRKRGVAIERHRAPQGHSIYRLGA